MSARTPRYLSRDETKDRFALDCLRIGIASAVVALTCYLAHTLAGLSLSFTCHAVGFGTTVVLLRLYVLSCSEEMDQRSVPQLMSSAFWRCTPALTAALVVLWADTEAASRLGQTPERMQLQAAARGTAVGALVVMWLTIKHLRGRVR